MASPTATADEIRDETGCHPSRRVSHGDAGRSRHLAVVLRRPAGLTQGVQWWKLLPVFVASQARAEIISVLIVGAHERDLPGVYESVRGRVSAISHPSAPVRLDYGLLRWRSKGQGDVKPARVGAGQRPSSMLVDV